MRNHPTSTSRVSAAYTRIAEAGRPEIWIALREENAAIAEAELIDARVARGEHLPLAGLVAAVKDNIDVADFPTTAGSPSYAYQPSSDSTAAARLRAAGAVIIGKTNLDQFATGLVGTRSPFGAVRNAWDPNRISGGSSSGSAVAVALGIVDIGLGTDTAGSGRVPAALNGIIGVKLTRGRIPTTGVVPACRTLDCVTVFARELGLASQTAEILSGDDGHDLLARSDEEVASKTNSEVALSAIPQIAIPTKEHLQGLAAGWEEAFDETVERYRVAGVRIVEVDIAPLLEAAALLYGGSFVAERFAAVGAHIQAHGADIGEDIDPTVASIVLGGATRTAVQLFDDQEKLERLARASGELLAGSDALLTPTTTWHPTLQEVAADPIGANSRMGRYTNFANLLDMCSIAIPSTTVDSLPFGVMLTAPAFHDRAIANLAETLLSPSVELLVVGAHLTGQPLNYQLVSAGGSLLRATETSAEYRLFALDTIPAKPGLVRVTSQGVAIRGELWKLPARGFASLVAGLPRPMAIGSVTLNDQRTVSSFLCEPVSIPGAEDISSYGGWLSWKQREDVQ
jgi:allophanate hydrolase